MSEFKFEYMRGTGPGGQHKNKTNSACRVTHVPTGLTAYADERSQSHSRKAAVAELQARIKGAAEEKKAAAKKEKRDEAIQPQATVRTYNYCRGVVKDHRTGKTASIKDVMGKGNIEKLR